LRWQKPKKELKSQEKKALMVVAHPDDEVLFGSTLLYRNRHHMHWVILCMTNKSHSTRQREFMSVINRLNKLGVHVSGEIFDVVDGKSATMAADHDDMKIFRHALQKHISDADLVVSHGQLGEYGHEDHKFVFSMCQALIGDRRTRNSSVDWITFKSMKAPEAKGIPLSDSERDFKNTLLTLYKSQKKVFNLPLLKHYVRAEGFDAQNDIQSSAIRRFLDTSAQTHTVTSVCALSTHTGEVR
jgi:LmbE family N-acetylglucosaminyl deacetylase